MASEINFFDELRQLYILWYLEISDKNDKIRKLVGDLYEQYRPDTEFYEKRAHMEFLYHHFLETVGEATSPTLFRQALELADELLRVFPDDRRFKKLREDLLAIDAAENKTLAQIETFKSKYIEIASRTAPQEAAKNRVERFIRSILASI